MIIGREIERNNALYYNALYYNVMEKREKDLTRTLKYFQPAIWIAGHKSLPVDLMC